MYNPNLWVSKRDPQFEKWAIRQQQKTVAKKFSSLVLLPRIPLPWVPLLRIPPVSLFLQCTMGVAWLTPQMSN